MIRLILFVFLLAGCASRLNNANDRYIKTRTYNLYMNAPGTISTNARYMVDETEITNFSWAEYYYWAIRVFGDDSVKKKNILPKTNVWDQTDTCLQDLSKFYFVHPVYRDYPVVGITQEQANAFCKWRSDRVFEYMLIRAGKVNWQPDQHTDDYFTIERYFAGEYKNYKPDTSFLYVPVYDLPSSKIWYELSVYNDSLFLALETKSKKHKHIYYWINTDMVTCNALFGVDVTTPVKTSDLNLEVDNFIYNIRGNVSEWTSQKDTAMGGSWNDSRKAIFSNPVFVYKEPNAYTGFRCICRWRKVNEYLQELKKTN